MSILARAGEDRDDVRAVLRNGNPGQAGPP